MIVVHAVCQLVHDNIVDKLWRRLHKLRIQNEIARSSEASPTPRHMAHDEPWTCDSQLREPRPNPFKFSRENAVCLQLVPVLQDGATLNERGVASDVDDNAITVERDSGSVCAADE